MIVWNDYAPGDHRTTCPACGRSPKDKTLGVTIAGEGHGVAHCFRCGYVESRREDRELTPAEKAAFARRMDAMRRQHEAEQHQRQVDTAAAAAIRWAAADPADGSHPYLQRKGVRAHGLRTEGGGHTLLIPMRDTAGHLHGLQSIAPDGFKRFMPGGRVKGCYHAIGGRPSGKIVIAEGYATAASVFESTGHAVAVAFNAGNLPDVAKALRGKFPCIDIILAADDDAGTDGNPGRTYAEQAALTVGGVVVLPMHPRRDPGKSCDFNDLAALAGLDAVRTCFAEVLA